MQYRAIIFDLFGTLVPFSIAGHQQTLGAMSALLSTSLADPRNLWTDAYARQELGEPIEHSILKVCQTAGIDPTDDCIQRTADVWRRFQHRLLSQPRPDAISTLNRLRATGHRIGIITNCPAEVPGLWDRSPLSPNVDVPVFSSECHLLKPDRRIYELMCERLAVQPSQSMYVGDGGSNELYGAQLVGMRAVQLRTPDLSFAGNDPEDWKGETISSLSEVLTLFQQ